MKITNSSMPLSRRYIGIMAALAFLLVSGCKSSEPSKATPGSRTASPETDVQRPRVKMKHNLESNKKAAIEFYRTAYLGNPSKAVEEHVGANYIQHNPHVADGKQAFIEYFDEMARDYPTKSIKFLRAVAEGDLVALHTHQSWPGNSHYVTMDFFRFDDNGKIVEHWDSIQGVPSESKNGNTMY